MRPSIHKVDIPEILTPVPGILTPLLVFGLNNDARIALLDILEDRYGNGSTMITSQLPVDSWYNFIDEPTLADAIMDRLSASAHRIALTGKSLRNRKNH